LTSISKVLIAFIIRAMIALIMEAVSTSETSVNFYETTSCNIPEGCQLHANCCKNFKSQYGARGMSREAEWKAQDYQLPVLIQFNLK
jgi:hypothetical protein